MNILFWFCSYSTGTHYGLIRLQTHYTYFVIINCCYFVHIDWNVTRTNARESTCATDFNLKTHWINEPHTFASRMVKREWKWLFLCRLLFGKWLMEDVWRQLRKTRRSHEYIRVSASETIQHFIRIGQSRWTETSFIDFGIDRFLVTSVEANRYTARIATNSLRWSATVTSCVLTDSTILTHTRALAHNSHATECNRTINNYFINGIQQEQKSKLHWSMELTECHVNKCAKCIPYAAESESVSCLSAFSYRLSPICSSYILCLL